jgi:hypothetical protein
MPGIDVFTAGPPANSSSGKPAKTIPEAWSDQEFCEAFESLRIPNEMFHHREHIRLAWVYSSCFSHEEAVSRMVQGIQAFAKHHGAAAKYHHTITMAWMRLVWHAAHQIPVAADFNAFAAAHSHLLNSRLLEANYSQTRLRSDAAKHAWMEPDLRSLP